MNRRTFIKTLPAVTVLASTVPGFGDDLSPIVLPKPEKDGGKSVLAALQLRKTTRGISAKKLPLQVLSNLLWAAFGVNRETAAFGKPGRTAPSASNSQEIDLYVAMPEGVYIYDAVPHRLNFSGSFACHAAACSGSRVKVLNLLSRSAKPPQNRIFSGWSW